MSMLFLCADCNFALKTGTAAFGDQVFAGAEIDESSEFTLALKSLAALDTGTADPVDIETVLFKIEIVVDGYPVSAGRY